VPEDKPGLPDARASVDECELAEARAVPRPQLLLDVIRASVCLNEAGFAVLEPQLEAVDLGTREHDGTRRPEVASCDGDPES
jgi:hypothetical protein